MTGIHTWQDDKVASLYSNETRVVHRNLYFPLNHTEY